MVKKLVVDVADNNNNKKNGNGSLMLVAA